MKPVKKVFFAAVLCVLLCLLAGCGAKLHTVLTVDSHFAGTRDMVMELTPDNLSQIEGGQAAIDRVIRAHCPVQITAAPSVMNENGNTEYTFTITFGNLADYTAKVEALLKRAPSVQFSTPDNVLASGFRVSEDFTSDDLMAWLKEAVAEEELASGTTLQSLWSMDTTALRYDGQSYATGHKIHVDQINAQPVSNVTVDTVKEEAGFTRTLRMTFPAATVQTLGDELVSHFTSRVPDAAAASWEDVSGGRTFTVKMTGATAQELETLSRALFSSVNQSLLDDRDEGASTPLLDQRLFVETMDLSEFSSGRSGGVQVEYRFEDRTASGLTGGYTYADGDWREVGTTQGQSFVYTGAAEVLSLQVISAQPYYIERGAVTLRRNDDGSFERTLTFEYDTASQTGGAAYAAAFFDALSEDENAPVKTNVEQTGGKERCVVTMRGSDSALSALMSKAFGTDSFLTYARSKGALNFKVSSSLTDSLNLTDALYGDNKNVPITYTLDMGGETLREFHCLLRDADGNTTGQEDYFPDPETGLVTFVLSGSSVEILATGEALNLLGILLVGGIVLCILLILILLIILIVKNDKTGRGPAAGGDLALVEREEVGRLARERAEEEALTRL